MANIRTVNLLREKRVRGTHPIAPYALDDEGATMLALPRPLEARAYDLTLVALDGAAAIRAGFAVETLGKLLVAAGSSSCIGITVDDLYLFHEGKKSRFLGDRRVVYVDATLDGNGRQFLAAFSDMAGSSFAVACGDTSGKILWMQDMETTLTATVISRLGNRMAVGSENGRILLLDTAKREVWEFGQNEPIRALASSNDGVNIAYGTADGAVGLIDGYGTRLWEVCLSGEVAAVALSSNAEVCAALVHPRSNPLTTHIVCIGSTGQVGWEFDAEQMLLGLSLSPDGTKMATGSRSGMTAVYEVVPGEGMGAGSAAVGVNVSQQAGEMAAVGDLLGASRLLQTALDADPANTSLCEELVRRRADYFTQEMARTGALQEVQDYAAAIAALEGLRREDPLNTQVVERLAVVRQAHSRHRATAAQTHLAAREYENAETALLESIAAAPFESLDSRRELGALRGRRAQEADTEAERLLAAGELAAGVAALERAQASTSDPARAGRLQKAHTAMEFAMGMEAYNARLYAEAIFQFKKALARDPVHSEAKRYLAFAQQFAQEASTETLSDRFSRLEQ